MDGQWSGDNNSVISAGFKAFWNSDKTDPKGDGSKDNEIQIDLGAQKTIASVFIANATSQSDRPQRIGNTYVYVGDDATVFSDELQLGTSQAINNGGFINLDTPLTGRYVVFRRDGASLPGAVSNSYVLWEIKVYGSTNLLNYGAQILSQPEAT